MLNSSDPFSFVNASVCPSHLSKSLPFIILVVSLVLITTSPCKHSKPVFLVLVIIPLVRVRMNIICIFLPSSSPLFEPLMKLPNVQCSSEPLVLPDPMGHSIQIVTRIHISIWKELCPGTVLHEVFPLTFVFVPIRPCMDPKAISFWVLPFSNVDFTIFALPHSMAIFHAVFPVSVVDFARFPLIDSNTVGFAIFKVASVPIPRWITFIPRAISKII